MISETGEMSEAPASTDPCGILCRFLPARWQLRRIGDDARRFVRAGAVHLRARSHALGSERRYGLPMHRCCCDRAVSTCPNPPSEPPRAEPLPFRTNGVHRRQSDCL